ncbi:unnamed protein product [Macrosiphum euphorbiae]|uniref:Uncharacterized protein n=1 Tax=Macrosiphum euphorbiae TaxID=13131 RepID=A0AAV0X964_9HEMI|nr:unnamed protein product [Macrosiphum euphorbiae]
MHETVKIDSPSAGDSMQTASVESLSGPTEMVVANYVSSKFRYSVGQHGNHDDAIVATEVKIETPPVWSPLHVRPVEADACRYAVPVQCRTSRCGLFRTTSSTSRCEFL